MLVALGRARVEVGQGEQKDLVVVERGHQGQALEGEVGLAVFADDGLLLDRALVAGPTPFGRPDLLDARRAQPLVSRHHALDEVAGVGVRALGLRGVRVVRHGHVEVEGAQAAELFDHQAAAVAHLAEIGHAGHGDGLAWHRGAQTLHRRQQHAAIAFGVGLGRPEAQDVGLVPDLPDVDLRVALGHLHQALCVQARIARWELVEVALVLVARFDRRGKTRRAHHVDDALESAALDQLHHAVDGGEVELALFGLEQHPVQAQAHPVQAQLLHALHLARRHLGREPLQLGVQAQEVLPDHGARRLEHLLGQLLPGPGGPACGRGGQGRQGATGLQQGAAIQRCAAVAHACPLLATGRPARARALPRR